MRSTDGVLKRMRADDNEINDEIEAAIIVARNLGIEPMADFSRLHRLRRRSRRLNDNPSTATPLLNDITAFYRCEFFKFIDSLISTLGEKSQSLTNVFQPFLKVIDPDTPGSLDDARALVAALPSVFSQDTFATLHNEFKVFEHLHQRVQGEFHTDDKQPCRITRAANIALSLASKHGLFKLVSRVYQLFLTAAPSVCKNERSFSALRRIKNHLRSTMGTTRLNDCMLLAVERNLTHDIDLKKLALSVDQSLWKYVDDTTLSETISKKDQSRIQESVDADPDGKIIKKYNLSHFRNLFLAGEHCDNDTLKWASNVMKCPVLDHWWQTETGWPITAHSVGLGDVATEHLQTTGRPVPGYNVRVIKPDLTSCKKGEIVIRLPLPPGVASTLWKNDKRFLESYFEKYPGHYDSMDEGIIDFSGCVSIMTRADDVINVAGHRLSTKAIEE
ncbi:acyl- synthetase short-chain family member 3, mitochondrial, partial, partial [Paramuricea clavata]